MLTAAAVQIDASIPNFLTQEYTLADEADHNAMYKRAHQREGGYLRLSDAPGIGIEVNEDMLNQASFSPRPLQVIPMRVDGSVGYSV